MFCYQEVGLGRVRVQFLLAFQSVHSALHWAVATQQALLSLDWDKQLLLHSAAREEYDAGGTLVFAGLRVQVRARTLPICTLSWRHRALEWPVVGVGTQVTSLNPLWLLFARLVR